MAAEREGSAIVMALLDCEFRKKPPRNVYKPGQITVLQITDVTATRRLMSHYRS